MMTREKWIVRWYDGKTGKQVGQQTLYDEDKALELITRKLKEGYIVEDEFFPDG